jgi:hypothetical protein
LGSALRQFWSANRRLQHAWLSELRSIPADIADRADQFERLALEVWLIELLTRVWATTWTIADRSQRQHDAERIFVNMLQGMARIRREVLLLMVRNWQGPAAETVTRLDRFRRRTERWTDLLIAGPATNHGVWEFAVEPERARDFGLEWSLPRQGSAHAASLLVSAGLRVMFGSRWPLGCCQAEPFAELAAAILSTLPATAFDDDGHLRPAWARPE